MTLQVTFRPIDTWPGEQTTRRKSSPFRVGYSDTLDLLAREIRHLGGRDVVIQLALSESDIRLDGLPRAHASPRHPGVILAFESKHGPLKYPCDTFRDWQDNLRAIALALEALRKVDRYGVTKRGEQYTGWKALPAQAGVMMTATAAAEFIACAARDGVATPVRAKAVLESVDVFRGDYRTAARKLHPDAGGWHDAFTTLQTARRVLEAHHSGAERGSA